MAKKATGKAGSTGKKSGAASGTSVARVSSANGGGSRKESSGGFDASEAFVKLLQSPLVAELVAVAATAALASLAEHGFTTGGGGTRGKRAGKAVKEAGKAAAAAIGRRLGNEFDEIKQAAKSAKAGAEA
jgi:hypothetical protein